MDTKIFSKTTERCIDISVTKVVTGKIILHYPHLFERWAFNRPNDSRDIRLANNKSDGKYSTGIVIPKTDIDTINHINIGIEKAIKIGKNTFGGEVPDHSSLQLPLNDGDNWWVSDIMYKNNYYMTATSKYQPEVVDKNKKKVYPYEICDGSYARVSILFSPYNINGKMGVSCVLNNVQLLDGVYRPSWSTAEEDFS